MQIRLEFKPQDLWVGLYWRRRYPRYEGLRLADRRGVIVYCDVWICLVPMLPLHLSWETRAC
jgi:hypothetical protein